MQAILTHNPDSIGKLEFLVTLFETDRSVAKNPKLSNLLETVWTEVEELAQHQHPAFKMLLLEALEDADRELHETGNAEPTLERLTRLTRSGGDFFHLKCKWDIRLSQLQPEELESTLLANLRKAVRMLENGKKKAVSSWLSQMKDHFVSTYERYRSMRVLPHEVTAETSLCHDYLEQGIDSWSAALDCFAEGLEGELHLDEMMELAEDGQRFLKIVEQMKVELQKNLAAKVGI